MSQRNVDLIREFFDTYRRGDHDASLSCLAPDVEYKVSQEATAHGREAVRAIWERWESSFDEIETLPEEFVDAGDHVVVTVRYVGRGRGSGIEFDQRSYEVCTVRGGECVRKVEFADRAEAFAAAGISG
jgi:ketosteroid isomerase-like protein